MNRLVNFLIHIVIALVVLYFKPDGALWVLVSTVTFSCLEGANNGYWRGVEKAQKKERGEI